MMFGSRRAASIKIRRMVWKRTLQILGNAHERESTYDDLEELFDRLAGALQDRFGAVRGGLHRQQHVQIILQMFPMGLPSVLLLL